MKRLTKSALAVGGIVVGAVTLRRLRAGPDEEVEEVSTDLGHEDAETPTDHAKAAAEHARIAAKQAAAERQEAT